MFKVYDLEKHFGALSLGTLKLLSKTSLLWIKYTSLAYIYHGE